MRYLAWIIVLLPMLFFSTSYARTPVDSLYDFMEFIRDESGIDSTASILTNDELQGICQRAIYYTSSDIGGVEAIIPIVTVKHQKFYYLPDTVVEVVHQVMTIGKETYPIIAWPPELYEITQLPDWLPEDNSDDANLVPNVYNVWADSIQLMPIPVRDDDTIYFKCFVEHPLVDSNGSTIYLRGAYLEAGFDYAFHLLYRALGQYDISAIYLKYYEDEKVAIRTRVAEQSIDNYGVKQ